jgi:CDP-diacylglycerol---serine O-phosphatidyltransferase
MEPERKKPLSMLRSYTPADALTIGNASSGTISIFLCVDYMAFGDERRLWAAMWLLPLALVFDVADGYVARLSRMRQSLLGADLDSLADVISFGVAPAVLGYTLGMRGAWDIACLTFFVVAGVSRLARYNVTSAVLTDSDTRKVRYFEGTPIPTSVVIVGLLAIALWTGHVQDNLWLGGFRVGPWLLHPLALVYVLSGSAMISTIRIPKP